MVVVRHALQAIGRRYDYLVLLQPTSPLRIAADIDAAVERCLQGNAPTCLSVCEPDKSPYWMMTMAADGTVQQLFPPEQIPTRRQDAPPIFAANGAVYVAALRLPGRGRRFHHCRNRRLRHAEGPLARH